MLFLRDLHYSASLHKINAMHKFDVWSSLTFYTLGPCVNESRNTSEQNVQSFETYVEHVCTCKDWKAV